MKALKSLEQTERDVQKHFEDVRKVYSRVRDNPLGGAGALVPASLEGLEQGLKDMQDLYDREKTATAELGRKHSQIQNLKAEISDQFQQVKRSEERRVGKECRSRW